MIFETARGGEGQGKELRFREQFRLLGFSVLQRVA